MLALVSLNPGIINILSNIISLRRTEFPRLFVLIILSIIMLWFIILYLKSSLDNHKLRFDSFVQGVGFEKYKETVREYFKGVQVAILIPAYNEENNLRELLPQIPEKIFDTKLGVLVIDDGSYDNTFSVVSQHGFCSARNAINSGQGSALRLGYSLLDSAGVQICITMDADGQHNPKEIEQVASPVHKGEVDFVIGSRILGDYEKDSLIRIIGVHFFGYIVSWLIGKRITDTSSGFRAFKVGMISKISMEENQYHSTELIVRALKNNITVKEVPIKILKRKYGKSKKGKNLEYGFNFMKIIIKSFWRQSDRKK